MQDHYSGQPGTYYTDPDTGTRLSAEEWQDKQIAQSLKAAPAKDSAKDTPQPTDTATDAAGE